MRETLLFCLLLSSLRAQTAVEAVDLVRAARSQIGVTVAYDPEYSVLQYPEGDVPAERGVCTDVVIRAYRKCGVDLQKLVHEDMKQNFSKYPALWNLRRPDPNIDHRRVPNLQRFFQRQGANLKLEDYQPGDLVTCLVPPHCRTSCWFPIKKPPRLPRAIWSFITSAEARARRTCLPVSRSPATTAGVRYLRWWGETPSIPPIPPSELGSVSCYRARPA